MLQDLCGALIMLIMPSQVGHPASTNRRFLTHPLNSVWHFTAYSLFCCASILSDIRFLFQFLERMRLFCLVYLKEKFSVWYVP